MKSNNLEYLSPPSLTSSTAGADWRQATPPSTSQTCDGGWSDQMVAIEAGKGDSVSSIGPTHRGNHVGRQVHHGTMI